MANNYTAGNLVHKLHSLPHEDLHMHATSHTFRLDLDYYESLALMSAPFAILLVIGILLVSIVYCVAMNLKPRTRTRAPTKCEAVSPILLVCGMIGLCCVPVALYGNSHVTDAVTRFTDDVEKAQTTFNDAIGDCRNLVSWAPSTKHKAYVLEMAIPQEERSKVRDDFVQMNSSLDELHDVMESVVDDADGAIDTDEIIRNIRRVNRERSLWTIVFECVLGVVMITVVINSVITRSKNAACWSAVFWGLFFVVTNLVAAAYFIMMVGMADFCVDPNQAAMDITHNLSKSEDLAQCSIDKNGKTNYDVECIVGYYVNCPPVRSPFQNDLTSAEYNFNTTVQKLDEAKAIFNTSGLNPAPVTNLESALNTGNSILMELQDTLVCTDVHNDYVQAVTALCDDALVGLTLMMLSTTAVSLFLLLAAVSVRCVSRPVVRSLSTGRYFYANDSRDADDDVDMLVLNIQDKVEGHTPASFSNPAYNNYRQSR
eukprot:m.335155 g.335155  ORF g.335155 m.335155 type:complete len:485 (+) comp17526_c0_seq1:322-1776(+)